jgi:hypothetical protein
MHRDEPRDELTAIFVACEFLLAQTPQSLSSKHCINLERILNLGQRPIWYHLKASLQAFYVAPNQGDAAKPDLVAARVESAKKECELVFSDTIGIISEKNTKVHQANARLHNDIEELKSRNLALRAELEFLQSPIH